MSNLINISCANCGTILSLPKSIKFATCNQCNTALVIKQQGHVSYTEIKGKTTPPKRSTTNDNHSKREALLEELAALERSWMNELERHKNNGTLPEFKAPSEEFGLFVPIIMGAFAIIGGAIGAFTSGRYPILMVSAMGFFWILMGLYNYNIFYTRKQKYETALHEYERKRKNLEQHIQSLK